MDVEEALALAVLVLYFLAIFVAAGFVFLSLQPHLPDLLNARPSLFLRVGSGALLTTWYYMFQFFHWSYTSFAMSQHEPTMAQWLVRTSLFDQAWQTVCRNDGSWWWTSWICTWAVLFTAIVWQQAQARGIKYPIAYIVLGQLVAMSFSTSLFLAAIYVHPVVRPDVGKSAPAVLYLPLAQALAMTASLPSTVGDSTRFLVQLLGIHLLVVVPLLFDSRPGHASALVAKLRALAIPFKLLYPALAAGALLIHFQVTRRVQATTTEPLLSHLAHQIFSHPAQASVSLDVVWVAVNLVFWLVFSGSATAVVAKAVGFSATAAVIAARFFGVHWGFVASVIPIVLLLTIGGSLFALGRIRDRNVRRRAALLANMGLKDGEIVPGDVGRAPAMSKRQTVVGFWHPYCNAGGGGERVLWTAVAYLQRQPDVVVLVYSGDYPAASKEDIIGKVKDRFSIDLAPNTLHFVPLKSRHLISDDYWSQFTLLGQSLGSMRLAWEGLCGADGLWGDVFIDSMGYAFTLPFARIVAGSEIKIGAYVHYPTVSADMVKRVRQREAGVENGGVAGSHVKTAIKLFYYRLFTSLYTTALLFSEYTMTNSSWTQAHIQSLIKAGKNSTLASLLLLDELSERKRKQRGEAVHEAACEVVYPPCDTAAFVGLKLEGRSRELISLAQFRPEKDHAKQIEALAALLAAHPELRAGDGRVHLTMMGGSRGDADEQRLDGLRRLAQHMGVEDNVKFLVNAPYDEVVRRLGGASIGLNTMVDEHFGISVVEFMAAGLISVVHASAGPRMDIVVPFKGQRTGFHATDAAAFADAIFAALSLPTAQQIEIRRAARAAAVERFGEDVFEGGFARAWESLKGRRR